MAEARRRLEQVTGVPAAEVIGVCLHATDCLLEVFHELGIPALLQAGSMQWIFVPEDEVGPNDINAFSFMFEPEHPVSVWARAASKLPEMHIWVALPESREIVDITTGNLPKELQHRLQLEWKSEPPPDFLWSRSVHPNSRYEPVSQASIYACLVLWKIKQPAYLEKYRSVLEEAIGKEEEKNGPI